MKIAPDFKKLKIIVANEYRTDIGMPSFWVMTLIVPVLFFAFAIFGAFMMDGSGSLIAVRNDILSLTGDSMTAGSKVIGMLTGIFLVLFLMMYGSQIFNKVKAEKTNRIYEIMATCVDGRTMMLSKIVAVAMLGLTQFLIWIFLIIVVSAGLLIAFDIHVTWDILASGPLVKALFWNLAFFAGGYLFYGSMFAAIGAMSGRNNENQEYVAILTFILLASFYVGEYAVDNPTSVFATVCSLIPFTAPTVACVNAATGAVPVWQSLLELLLLWVLGLLSLVISGKIYTSSMLMKGKKLTLRDILTFLKS